VAGHDDGRRERDQALDRGEPVLRVGVADERNASGEQEVAGEQRALVLDQQHDVVGRVRAAGVDDAERRPAERNDVSPSTSTSGFTSSVVSSTHGNRSARRCASRSAARPELK
jgi:hypothetical protein